MSLVVRMVCSYHSCQGALHNAAFNSLNNKEWSTLCLLLYTFCSGGWNAAAVSMQFVLTVFKLHNFTELSAQLTSNKGCPLSSFACMELFLEKWIPCGDQLSFEKHAFLKKHSYTWRQILETCAWCVTQYTFPATVLHYSTDPQVDEIHQWGKKKRDKVRKLLANKHEYIELLLLFTKKKTTKHWGPLQ